MASQWIEVPITRRSSRPRQANSRYEDSSQSSRTARQNRPRPRQTSHRNENSSQSTEIASQSSETGYQKCPKCNKNVRVKNNGNLYSHSPCNQNIYDVLRAQDDDNDNIVDTSIAPLSNHQSSVRVPTRTQHRANTPPSTQDTIRTIVDSYQGKKTGPKFRTTNIWAATFESYLHQLHNEVNSSNNIESITTIIVQLLLCTPPNSKIQESVDNTLTINEDDGHYLPQLDTLLPSYIQDRPKIAASVIAAIKKDLNHGNISKATRKLLPGGPQSLKNKPIRDIITAKYPTTQLPTQNRQNENRINSYDEDMINFSDEIIQIATIKHIFNKKRGASKSAYGFCNDHIQDLLYHCPNAIPGLFTLLQTIAHGRIQDKAAEILFRGRGIALGQGKKNNPHAAIKTRPIVIQDPFHNLAAHMIAAHNRDKAIEICGPNQLGNDIKGGPEILAHTISCMLQMYPDWTVVSFDGNDAFNSLDRNKILQSMENNCPNMLPYTTSLFNKATDIIYNDHKNNITLRVEQSNGIQQGNSAATRSHNLAQAPAVHAVKELHPHVKLIQIHDDQYILGTITDVLAAHKTLKREMKKIGIEESIGKSKIYSPTEISDINQIKCRDENNLTVIPPLDGIIVAGIPIGSEEYIKTTLSNIIDGIEIQMETLLSAHTTISTAPRADVHTLYTILKLCIPSQFNHILRTCLPSLTLTAASRLDDLVIKFYLRITNIDTHFNNLPRQQQQKLLDKIFLTINRGGMGITSSVRTAKAAFTGSICLCAQWMGRIAPELIIPTNSDNHPTLMLPTFHEFNNIIKELQATMPKQQAVQEIDIYDIWNTQTPGMQHLINTELHAQAQLSLEARLPIASSDRPNYTHATLSPNDRGEVTQCIQNLSTVASAWLQSNPGDYESHMDNYAFITSTKQRLQVPTIADRTHCECQSELDITGTHFFACKNRKKIRNPAHKHLKDLVITIADKINKETGNNWHIQKFEPEIDRYYPKKNDTTAGTHTGTAQQQSNDPTQNNDAIYENSQIPKNIDKRADIAIINGSETILIDVTIVEAAAQYIKPHGTADAPANQRAEDKMKTYTNTHNMNEPFNRNTKFFIASTTTQAALGKQFHKLFNHLVQAYPENIRGIKLRQIHERFSSRMHKITSDNFKYSLNLFGRSYNYQNTFENYQNINHDHPSQFRNQSNASIRSPPNHSQSRQRNSRPQQRNSSANQIIPLSTNFINNLRSLSVYLQSQTSLPETTTQDIQDVQEDQNVQEVQDVQAAQDSPQPQDLSTNNIH